MGFIQRTSVFTLTLLVNTYSVVGNSNSNGTVEGMIFEINKDACVSDPYRTVSGVFSLSVCSQLCLSDDSCKAITFMSDTNDCQLSDTEDTHVCSLLEGGGTLTEPPEPGICQPGMAYCVEAAGVYYEFIDTPVDWDTAQAACQSGGGQLAVLDTEEKYDLMYELRGSHSEISGNSYWIGLHDADCQHNWMWVDGQPLIDGSYGWAATYPKHANNDNCEWCAEAQRRPGTQYTRWRDHSCTSSIRYICEYEL